MYTDIKKRTRRAVRGLEFYIVKNGCIRSQTLERDLKIYILPFVFLMIGCHYLLDKNPKTSYFGIMKTTIDIPESELMEAMKYTGAKTKRAAVVFALRDFNKRQRLAHLSKMLGTFEDFMTQDELQTMREDEKWDLTK